MKAAFDVTAITKALVEAEKFITALVVKETGMEPKDEPMVWRPVNGTQVQLMRRFDMVRSDLAGLPELQAWAKDTAEELNAILELKGFSIRLEHWEKSPDKFGVVAIYDITIEWLEEGAVADEDTGQAYILSGNKPAFRLDSTGAGVRFYKVGGRIIAKIPGKKSGDYLCITKTERDLDQFELLGLAETLRLAMTDRTSVYDFGGIVMPNIVFDVQPDISWLIGLNSLDFAGSPWVVTQAKMQAKFAMGRLGAHAKVAVALGFERCVMVPEPKKPDYIVDHDVVIWMERDNVGSVPFFVAYVTKDEFADHQVELTEID